MHSWADSQQVVNEVEARRDPESSISVGSVLAAWRAAQPKAKRIARIEAGLADKISIRTPAKDWLKNYLPRAAPWSTAGGTLAVVGLPEIIAPQRFISLDHVRFLANGLPPSPTNEDLVRLCMTQTDREPILVRTLAPNRYMFASRGAGLRILGMRARRRSQGFAVDGSSPDIDWTVSVGFGFPWVTALKFQDRLILINGLHRLFALLQLGVTEAPVIVHQIDGVAGLPAMIGGSSAVDLLSAPRPPLLKDFLDHDLAITLDVRNRANALIISIAVEPVLVAISDLEHGDR